MKKVLIASGVAVLAFAMIAGAQGMVFSTNLTVGSTGSDVAALQTWLNANGFNIPAITSGVAAPGYFGSQTKAAVQAYQASKGIPNTGFVGPLTRAALNATGVTVTPGTTVVCPVGYTCIANPGTVVTPGTSGITTPGAEGTLTVSSNNSGLVSTVYEGESQRPILGFNVEADNSDLLIQRVKVNLGTNSKIYTKGYTKLYVTDGSTILASMDLNSSTVTKESSTYYATLTGLNFLVQKDTKKQLVIKADVMSSIDSADRDTLTAISILIPQNGVRALDGAGIDQYGPSSNLTGRTTTFSADLAENATLKLSINSASPKKAEVIASSGASENEYDRLTTLVFDVRAEKDDVKITDIVIGVAKTGSGAATAQTAYLYEGSTELDSASVSGDLATFSDFDYVVPRDTTKTLTVKIDVRSANGVAAVFTTKASTTVATHVVAENSSGDSITESGSAIGYSQTVRNIGPEISLVSRNVTKSVSEGTSAGVSTTTLSASFTFRVKAVGGDIMLGLTQATTSPFVSSSTPTTGSQSFTIYRNGVADATLSSYATSTSFTVPSLCSTSNLTNSCLLSEGNSVDIPVTFSVANRTTAGALWTEGEYSVGVSALNWHAAGANGPSTFMAGEIDWTTPEVHLP